MIIHVFFPLANIEFVQFYRFKHRKNEQSNEQAMMYQQVVVDEQISRLGTDAWGSLKESDRQCYWTFVESKKEPCMHFLD